MSAATELDWDYSADYALATAPVPVRPTPTSAPAGPPQLASVTALHRLPEQATAPQLRLTPRGVRVVAAVVAVVALGLVVLARASAPSTAAPGRAVVDRGPHRSAARRERRGRRPPAAQPPLRRRTGAGPGAPHPLTAGPADDTPVIGSCGTGTRALTLHP